MPLDAQAQHQETVKATAEAAEPPPLDPPFPHVRTYFDPFFFNLQLDAREPAPSLFPEPL